MLGTRIKKLRVARKYKQKELADYLNVSIQVISNWERGYSKPDYEYLIKIAELFAVSVDFLLLEEQKITNLITVEKDLSKVLVEDGLTWKEVVIPPSLIKNIREIVKLYAEGINGNIIANANTDKKDRLKAIYSDIDITTK